MQEGANLVAGGDEWSNDGPVDNRCQNYRYTNPLSMQKVIAVCQEQRLLPMIASGV